MSATNVYDIHTATTSSALSAIAYCEDKNILLGNYSIHQNPTTSEKDIFPSFLSDFVPTQLFRNKDHDVGGFIGFSTKEKTIFVVFRGSKSVSNWLNNFDTARVEYPMCDR